MRAFILVLVLVGTGWATNFEVIQQNFGVARSDTLNVAEYQNDFYLSWTGNAEVSLIRGDFFEAYMLFEETVIYQGTDSGFIDTVGDSNTKYYTLVYPGGRRKLDINKDSYYELVHNNAMDINHDEDTLIREVRIAQFGRAMILKWASLYEGYSIDLNYSGTIQNDVNALNTDPYLNANYYIIDNVNNLTSMSVYEITPNERLYLFTVNLNLEQNPITEQNVISLVAGASNNVSIVNGTVNNWDDNITTNKNNGIFASGADGAGGTGAGGCFLKGTR